MDVATARSKAMISLLLFQCVLGRLVLTLCLIICIISGLTFVLLTRRDTSLICVCVCLCVCVGVFVCVPFGVLIGMCGCVSVLFYCVLVSCFSISQI